MIYTVPKFVVQYRQLAIAQNPLDTFPRNFLVDGEVANLATSRCSGSWETKRHKQHFGLVSITGLYSTVVLFYYSLLSAV